MSNFQTSIIKVFVYEVLSLLPPTDVYNSRMSKEYSFRKLKKKNKDVNPIKSKEMISSPRTLSYLFTENIIIDTNNVNNKNNISKNILKNNTTIEDLTLLYKEYCKYEARKNLRTFPKFNPSNNILFIELKLQIYNQIDNLLTTSTTKMNSYYTRHNFTNSTIDNNDEIIIKLNEDSNSKIIIMGDQHGSFHSFFRLIIRLIISGVIDKDYKLADNYKMIFLGDIIDRGNFGIEIMYIILKLFIVNNNEDNLRVIIIRGNHEEYDTFSKYGFENEIKRKINNNSGREKHPIVLGFINFYKYCPSAIILTQNNIKYWLCHGGFPVDLKKLSALNINTSKTVYLNKVVGNSQIRWNDFYNKPDDSTSSRSENSENKDLYLIGTNKLKEFLNKYNINFIIRGHQDDEGNAILLSKKNVSYKNINSGSNKIFNPPGSSYGNNDFFEINLVENKKLLATTSSKDLITYSPVELPAKAENEIAIINTNKFDMEQPEQLLYPVLTISNNCDLRRHLYNDSYVIIESSSQNGGKVKKMSDKFKKLMNSFKKEDLINIAKEYNILLKTKEGKIKSKEQLFNSLIRKKIIAK